MLLLQQSGTLKVGEVVRYTITYSPARDRILPHPTHLHLRIKNTSAIALRAAFMHGPYALYVSAAPSTHRVDVASGASARLDGVPEFEPNLKAGAAWSARLKVRGSGSEDGEAGETSWVVEVASQVVFSASAAVRFEVLVGRDEGSVGGEMGAGKGARAGVFSEALKVRVEDTAGLWNTPRLPEWEGEEGGEGVKRVGKVEEGKKEEGDRVNGEGKTDDRKQKKIHLVVLTHGLHSNLGADMLYMKESIDAGAKKAKEEAKLRREKRRKERAEATAGQNSASETSEQKHADEDDTDDEEDVIVRGFSGNAVRTEKGIKYLGKRLAKYVLAMTYPDQPFHSVSISAGESFKAAVTHDKSKDVELGEAVHPGSSIRQEPPTGKRLAYKITSISFIAHSLGGLVQTYAVAYIQKHSPNFFDKIQAVNFICLASPFLGLSNENPLYVKFALDFGLVGRTGQDLGLTWRAPTLARSGWGALVSGMGENGKKAIEHPRDPRSKPLLRILPTGPAHVALKKFRNRTVYSNVVNDGIVPLRTSCLLFLDWQGLGRVEKARRENGLVGTMAGWGWAELTGQNATAAARQEWIEEAKETEAAQASQAEANGSNTPTRQGRGGDVPQPPPDATEDDVRSLKSMKMTRRSTSQQRSSSNAKDDELLPPPPPHQSQSQSPPIVTSTASTKGPIDSFLDFFNPRAKSPDPPRQSKIYKRSQTVKFDDPSRKSDRKTDSSSKTDSSRKTDSDSSNNHYPGISSALPEDPQGSAAPPRTSFFEAAGDILSPPLPPLSFLIDPSTRPLTIFHDRVYHPEDIPPPPLKPPTTTTNKLSKTPPTSTHSNHSTTTTASDSSFPPLAEIDSSAMKVEEKIARAYHRDLSWRKVLVRLEPDAHNNIIVRRKFANAYGWPVVQHLVDTHFAGGGAALTPDAEEGNEDRAARKSRGGGRDDEGPAPHQFLNQALRREREEEDRESADHLSSLSDGVSTHTHTAQRMQRKPVLERADSEVWSERDFMDSEGDSDGEVRQEKEVRDGAAWNWTEKIVGRGAAGRGKRGLGGGDGAGPVPGGRGHRHKESREYTVPSPEEEEDEEDGVGGGVEGVSKGVSAVNLGVHPVAESDTHVGIVEEVARAS
ncbi:hypothetical protein VE03_06866 [Pseudogymnoascus sp. 23342-1-I1]|nr:hypothetical protein VE03_06866 [Pseudogymnoascus sp. 23342-1-I1]